MKAVVVGMFLGVKLVSGVYGTRRDQLANKAMNVAYGGPATQGGHH